MICTKCGEVFKEDEKHVCSVDKLIQIGYEV